MIIRCFTTDTIFVPISLASGYSVKPELGKSVVSLPPAPAATEEDAGWAELEGALPPNEELLASARRHRAPQQWYDERIGPR
jgi:hypothetical protein